MKKKIILYGIGLGIVLITMGVYFARNITKKDNFEKEINNKLTKIVNVDEVVTSPNSYKGFFGVQGTVIRIDKPKNIFLLGCENACVFMPVEYKGQMPKPASQIIVFGELIKQEDGRYIFQGKEVKTKW